MDKCPFLIFLLCAATDYEQPIGFSGESKRATTTGHQKIKPPAAERHLNDTFL